MRRVPSIVIAILVLSIALFGWASLPAAAQTIGRAPGSGTPVNTGPDNFPKGVNPLTGLPVADPRLLELPPAMVSVSSFPVSARPQAGLSFSPYVFEMYIGYGMTRYLAVFYGEAPKVASNVQSGSDAQIGPIRSGRLPYESLRALYNGALITSGASDDVGSQLHSMTRMYGKDAESVNSTLVDAAGLEAASETVKKSHPQGFKLTGNRFETAIPEGGQEAQKTWIYYNYYNQIEWAYDPAQGAYLRSQDKADGSGKFYPTTDKLNGEQLAFENVVVLFADHRAIKPTIIDIQLKYVTRPALLFRDGKVYQIYWTTENSEYEKQSGLMRPIRFVDADGNPFPMKPGQTWVEIVTSNTHVEQTTPGSWKVRFFAP